MPSDLFGQPAMDAPTPNPSVPPPKPGLATPRAAQAALAVFGAVLLGLLLFRGYGAGFGARPTEHRPAAAAHRVDLNVADKAELMQVPGIGPALADAILTHRQTRGSFAAVEDLSDVRGVGGATLDKLRPWVTVGERDAPAEPVVEKLERKSVAAVPEGVRPIKMQPGDPPLDLNTATEQDFTRLPLVGAVLAQRIVQTRAVARFADVDDLRRVRGIGAKTLEAVRPYVLVR